MAPKAVMVVMEGQVEPVEARVVVELVGTE